MNERIKELLCQAYDQAVPETWTTLSSEQLERVYEKFAQLIVRECAKSANYWYQNHDKIHSDPMSYVLAHFGVEE
jgi:hypothetical protein